MRTKITFIGLILFVLFFSPVAFADDPTATPTDTPPINTDTPVPTNPVVTDSPIPTIAITDTPVPTDIPTVTVVPTNIPTDTPTISDTPIPTVPNTTSVTPTPAPSNNPGSSSPQPTAVVQAVNVNATPASTPSPTPKPKVNAIAGSIKNISDVSNTVYSDIVKFPQSFFSHPDQQQYYQSDSLSKKDTVSLLFLSLLFLIAGAVCLLPDRFWNIFQQRVLSVRYSLTSLL
jgi:hypothetical protein